MLGLHLATAGLGMLEGQQEATNSYEARFFLYRSFDGDGLPASVKPCFSKSGIVPVKANTPGIFWFPGFVGLTG